VVAGGVPTALNALLSHLVRSEGRSMHAGVGIVLGGVLNIALDPLFMFVLLPKGSEVLGAALATMLSNVISMVYFLAVVYLHWKESVLDLRPTRRCLDYGIPKDVLLTGLPACLMTLFENISYAVLDNLMGAFGMMAQAGIGVAKKVNMLAHNMVRGMAQGVLPLIAYNFAARNYKRMTASVRLSIGISIALAAAWMAASLIYARNLIGIFIQHESPSLDYGIAFLKILCIGGPFSAFAYGIISFFQATGESLKSFLLAILRKGLLDIPLMFILLKPFPVYGIVWATPIADIACCIVAIVLFTAFMRRLLTRPTLSLHAAGGAR